MKLERLLGLLAMTGITLLALFLFFPSRHTDDISNVDSSTKTDLEQPILSVTKDFKILSDDFKDWLNKNPNIATNNNAVKDAAIDKDGNVVPMKKSTGNYIQQLD